MMHIAYRAKLLDTETMITTRHIYRQYERHKDKIFIAQFKGLHRIQASQDKINANYCTRNLYGYLQHKTIFAMTCKQGSFLRGMRNYG